MFVVAGITEAPFHVDVGLRNAGFGVVRVLIVASPPVENTDAA
jgi:hypothetical protein